MFGRRRRHDVLVERFASADRHGSPTSPPARSRLQTTPHGGTAANSATTPVQTSCNSEYKPGAIAKAVAVARARTCREASPTPIAVADHRRSTRRTSSTPGHTRRRQISPSDAQPPAGHVYLVVDVADFPWGFQVAVAVAEGRLAVTVACGDAV
jgi:hypothetical protein